MTWLGIAICLAALILADALRDAVREFGKVIDKAIGNLIDYWGNKK